MTLKPSPAYHFYHSLWSTLDLFFPPSCGGCGKLGFRWCAECRAKTIPLVPPVCQVCGQPQNKDGICIECTTMPPAFSELRSCAVYAEPVRSALIKLKYHREIGLGEALAWDFAAFLDRLNWQIDALLPIPLSAQRMAERGYNQVDLLAHPLARIMNWIYVPAALRRTRHTPSQVKLSGRDRKENVRGVFQADARTLAGKTVLVIDDIATTGSTISAACEALKAAGVKKIYAATFARASFQHFTDYTLSTPSR